MRGALIRGDGDALARTAHALKSACGTLGLRRMQALCGEIEAHGQQGDAETSAPLLARLHEEFGHAETALNEAVRPNG